MAVRKKLADRAATGLMLITALLLAWSVVSDPSDDAHPPPEPPRPPQQAEEIAPEPPQMPVTVALPSPPPLPEEFENPPEEEAGETEPQEEEVETAQSAETPPAEPNVAAAQPTHTVTPMQPRESANHEIRETPEQLLERLRAEQPVQAAQDTAPPVDPVPPVELAEAPRQTPEELLARLRAEQPVEPIDREPVDVTPMPATPVQVAAAVPEPVQQSPEALLERLRAQGPLPDLTELDPIPDPAPQPAPEPVQVAEAPDIETPAADAPVQELQESPEELLERLRQREPLPPMPELDPLPEPVAQPDNSEPQPDPYEQGAAAPDPAPTTDSAPSQREVQVAANAPESRATERQGRALLRLMETGSGPSVRIAWPSSASARERLYSVLTQCYGMETVLMNREGGLYFESGASGQPVMADTSRYSGFVRAAEGDIPSLENAVLGRIHSRHGLTRGSAQVVRLFPRRADALLLGGLSELIDGGLGGGAQVDARYEWSSRGLSIVDIRQNGQPIDGRVTVAPIESCREV